MPDQTSRVYTIPDTANFLDSLAAVILQGNLPVAGGPRPDPLNLTRYTLLLPTRRSCRTMRESFLRVSGNNAILLPRIMPIGDIDENLIELSSFRITAGRAESEIDIAPAISDLERRLVLCRLILKWSEATFGSAEKQRSDSSPVYTPAQASALASELMGLMDAVETEQVDLSRIRSIVPDKFSDHWQKTLEFLSIVIEYWPSYLEERKLLSPMNRRNLLLQAESKRLSLELPTNPIIAAGATGSIPAAARLLDVISKLPNGAVVLPGLDLTLDDDGWQAIDDNHPEHPQYGLKKLIDSIGIERSDVSYVPGTKPGETSENRLRLVSEVMRPAGTTERWVDRIADQELKAKWSEVLESINCIETPTAQDEAEVVSLILRNAIETPGIRAALVTPDRILGRRVSVRLLKWGIMVDDSAGRPLVKTPPGTFFELLSDAFEKNFAPAELLSLLKHPLTRLGYKAGEIRAATRAVELIALRQPLLGTGLDAIEIALDRMTRNYESKQIFHPVLGRLQEREWIRAKELIERLKAALEPLLQLTRSAAKRPIPEFVKAKIMVAEALARNHEGSFENLWQGEAGEALSIFLTNLLSEQIPGPHISAHEYPQLYRGLIAGQALRDRTPVHPRLFIWGPFEARLQQADVVVLGGLNEGVWPQVMEPDAWLNRPMRKELELPAIEELIGYSAHDFSQMLGTRDVYLTRASKQDGVPTVPSRWILRLQTLMKGMNLEDKLLSPDKQPWLDWALLRDRVEREDMVPSPNPKPPVKYRPRKLSVTQIEDWISNPY
ncbi:MAG: double-strand break repair protein AddB, partial [Methyloligellaceae bacterium]